MEKSGGHQRGSDSRRGAGVRGRQTASQPASQVRQWRCQLRAGRREGAAGAWRSGAAWAPGVALQKLQQRCDSRQAHPRPGQSRWPGRPDGRDAWSARCGGQAGRRSARGCTQWPPGRGGWAGVSCLLGATGPGCGSATVRETAGNGLTCQPCQSPPRPVARQWRSYPRPACFGRTAEGAAQYGQLLPFGCVIRPGQRQFRTQQQPMGRDAQ
jgi:hypothetical protein